MKAEMKNKRKMKKLTVLRIKEEIMATIPMIKIMEIKEEGEEEDKDQ